MAFTAQDVKTLREMTNVGMMDCKKALQATDGDMEKAVDWLREKGLAKAAKKAGRVAAEGMAYAKVCSRCGVGAVVEVNCETDFCAKSEAFQQFVKDICKVVLNDNPADVDALLQCKYPERDLTVAEILPEKVMSIGENLQIRRFARFANPVNVAYVHAGGTHGVLVNLAVEGDIDATEIGKNVAMQIAAMNPKYWDKSLVPQADIDHELEVQVALMNNDPKMAAKPRSTPSTRKTACCSRTSSAPTCSRAPSRAISPTLPRSWAAPSSLLTLSTSSRARASRRRKRTSPPRSLPR